jgi:DNA-binding NtrC family response regulator
MKLSALVAIAPGMAKIKIGDALARAHGQVDVAAKALRVSPRTLYNLIDKVGLTPVIKSTARAYKRRFRATD